MTLLSERNIQDLDDLKKRVINPYVYGHSFTFCGIDLVLVSVHQFRVFKSEEELSVPRLSANVAVSESLAIDITKEILCV